MPGCSALWRGNRQGRPHPRPSARQSRATARLPSIRGRPRLARAGGPLESPPRATAWKPAHSRPSLHRPADGRIRSHASAGDRRRGDGQRRRRTHDDEVIEVVCVDRGVARRAKRAQRVNRELGRHPWLTTLLTRRRKDVGLSSTSNVRPPAAGSAARSLLNRSTRQHAYSQSCLSTVRAN